MNSTTGGKIMENRDGVFMIYSRKSRYTGTGESIENQIEFCRQYIETHFGKEEAQNAVVYEDEGFSGSTLDRPQFRRMMTDSERINCRAIVVYRLDRISRSIVDFSGLIEIFKARGIDFISIREQFDTSSPMGRAMMYIASVFSQLERETIAERIRDNLLELAKTGRWLGGNTPYGYVSGSETRMTLDGKKRKSSVLMLVPDEADTVSAMFTLFESTGSLASVEQCLKDKGKHTRNKNCFSRFAIKGILCNPVYMKADIEAYNYFTERNTILCDGTEKFDGTHGIMVYNRTLQQPGKAHIIKPMEEWITAVGKHEGLVSGSIWIHVQELLSSKSSTAQNKKENPQALLSGILFCAQCGNKMRVKKAYRSDKHTPPEKNRFFYICTGKEKSRCQLCAVPNIRGEILDTEIITEICRIGEDVSVLKRELQKEKTRLLSESKYRKTDLFETNQVQENSSAHLQNVFLFENCFQKQNVEETRSFLRSIIEKITWDGEVIEVYYRESSIKPQRT